LRLHHVCGFFAVSFWQGRHPADWFRRSIARCLSIAAFTYSCPGHSTPRFCSSRNLARGFLISNCVSSFPAREKPSIGIFALFKSRRMSDCYNCTRPPCLALVADILNSKKKLVAACNGEIRQLPQPYTLL
jgi:hypothetical protein